MFKTKTHNAYIIIMINKESYIKKKSHNDSIKNHHDSYDCKILCFSSFCVKIEKSKNCEGKYENWYEKAEHKKVY